MPRYAYKCGECGEVREVVSTISTYDPDARPVCAGCHVAMSRSYDVVPFKMPMPGHMNPTVGRYVSGERDFRDGLKEASDAATESTGIPHNYQPVDLRDAEALGVTADGLADDARARHDAGRTPLDLPLDL